MYSYEGPVIAVPSGFFATGSVIVVLKPALSVPALKSHPLHTMLTQFKDVPAMPPGFLVPFASVLPFIEMLIGLCILIGFQTRAALIAGSLMITALTFGTMMRQDFTIAWLQLDYAIAFFILIALRQWNLISVDAKMGRHMAAPTAARV